MGGPVPNSYANAMVLPVLAPDPSKSKINEFGKYTFNFGGNRGRGQLYPEGNESNNNAFSAPAAGTISSIVDSTKEGAAAGTKTVTVTMANGDTTSQEVLPGATLVVKEGDVAVKDQQLSTNPNFGGFGQEEKDIVLQDVGRIEFYAAFAFSIFVAQLSFVLKKKQFEKVQLAEGF